LLGTPSLWDFPVEEIVTPARSAIRGINLNFCSRSNCPWAVEPNQSYRIYQDPANTEFLPRLTLLLQTDGSGHAGEGYRFVVKSERLAATIWSRDILDSPDLAGFQLNYELRGEEIEIRPNSLVSQWMDLDVLIGKGKVVVVEPGGGEPLNDQFRALWTTVKKKQVRLGAAVRWAIQATPRGELKLVLQGMPTEAQTLRVEPRLTADDCDTVHLDSFETNIDWEEEGPCRGPIPVLFARDPAAVRAALSAHPERVHAGLRAVVGSIPCTKRLHLDEAWQRTRSPPEASAVYPLRPVGEPMSSSSQEARNVAVSGQDFASAAGPVDKTPAVLRPERKDPQVNLYPEIKRKFGNYVKRIYHLL
jgi:hypothetical protein